MSGVGTRAQEHEARGRRERVPKRGGTSAKSREVKKRAKEEKKNAFVTAVGPTVV